MAHRVSVGGSYRIDRRFPGVGRIALASGAFTKGGLKKRDALMTRLYDKGRLDILRAIQGREITITEALDADRRDDLDSLVGVNRALAGNLWETVDEWILISAKGKHTRRRYEVSFRKLQRTGVLPTKATVDDLSSVDWRLLESEWEGSAADYNHVWRAISKFLSDVLQDVHHPFRRQVMKAIPKRPEPPRVPDISPELFWKIVGATPEFVRSSYIVLAVTGLRVGEYLALTQFDLQPHTYGIRVKGTKTAASSATVRVDPTMWGHVEAAVPSPLKYGWLRKYWKRALAEVGADQDLRLHDLRHCCAQWAAEEGVAEAKIQAQLRHTNPAMTRRYIAQRDRGEVASAVACHLFRSA